MNRPQAGRPQVMISGLGYVGGLGGGVMGCGAEALGAALETGAPALPIPPDTPWPDLSPWLSPRAARRMSPPSKLGVAATRMALEDAGLGVEELPDSVAVVASTAFGPSSHTEGLLEQIFEEGPEAASPFLFTESVANAAAAQIALVLRARGPNITVTQREAGPWIALARATREIHLGRAKLAVVLAVDELTELLLRILSGFRVLSRGAARPYDRRRDGLVPTAGATVLVLEPARALEARGGRARASVRGGIAGFDPSAPPAGWGQDPAPLAAALERGLGRLGVAPESIDRLVAGASGAKSGDRLEAMLWRRLYGDRPPPILAPKAVVGEYGGGALAAAVLAAEGLRFGATPGFREGDSETGIAPHDGRDLGEPTTVLAGALAAGGAGAWTVLGRP